MVIDNKTNLYTAAIATHFARLWLLLEGAWVYQRRIVFYNWHLDVVYFLLFLIDFIPFLMFWFLQSNWEFGFRVIGLFWIIMLMTILLPFGVGPGLLVLFPIQFLVLVWPKPYLSVISEIEVEVTDDAESLFRIRCVYCGATYSYDQSSVSNGQITCQNCGKVQRI
ncbi:MAG: hypothetical protein E4H14_13140 [Candidatus Thorarchaeota archaeon]|nr:MAG: hypothetical protein E4H14_13140 [Candidatus Thorarchaeota archaeon]